MSLRAVSTSVAPAAIGPYSQAIEVQGILYCSGQIPLDPETMELVSGGIEPETKRVFRNLAAVLTAGGSGLEHVVKVTLYLTDLGDFDVVNKIFQAAFKAHKPARSTVQVAALPKGARIEIDAVAEIVNALPSG